MSAVERGVRGESSLPGMELWDPEELEDQVREQFAALERARRALGPDTLSRVRDALWFDDDASVFYQTFATLEYGMDTQSLLDLLSVVDEFENRAAVWKSALADAISQTRDFEVSTLEGRVDGAAEAIAMQLGIPKRAAERMIRRGSYVRRRHFAFAAEFVTGHLSVAKMDAVVKVLDDVEPDVAAVVEDAVLPQHTQLTASALERALQRELITLAPEDAEAVEDRAAARRHVSRPRPEGIGMARMSVVLPAAAAMQLDAALEGSAMAALSRGDLRTRAQLRADALASWGTRAWHNLAAGESGVPGWTGAAGESGVPGWGGGVGVPGVPGVPLPANPKAAVTVTVPVDVLARAAALPGYPKQFGPLEELRADVFGVPACDADGTASPEHRGRAGAAQPSGTAQRSGAETVAWLDGYGPITPRTAALLAADGTWRRLVLDPLTGRPLDLGRRRYQPPQYLAETVRALKHTCSRPGCSRPAQECELDHAHEWHDGGVTSAANLQPLCKRCHRLKTVGLLGSHVNPDGTVVWYMRQRSPGQGQPPEPGDPSEPGQPPESGSPSEPGDPPQSGSPPEPSEPPWFT